MNPSLPARANSDLLDEKYAEWREDPRSVEPTWSAFFEGFELGNAQPPKSSKGAKGAGAERVASSGETPEEELAFRAKIVTLIRMYRSIGHTEAHTDPLSEAPPKNPDLSLEALGLTESDLDREVASRFFMDAKPMPLREMIAKLRAIYCGRTGFEIMHIHNPEVRNWLRDRIETRAVGAAPDHAEASHLLGWLVEAESFERFLHTKYVGQKRFSLEGGESLMVALNAVLHRCPADGVSEIVMGMAHRGRLNVLANFLRKPLKVLLNEFSENFVPDLVAGDGDVKYHLGFETEQDLSGANVLIKLAANPSHLEAVNPVVEGMARARQRIIGDDRERRRVLPILIHGDAAFAGQGIVAEVLNLSQLQGYRTGGTIHIVVNNQIGFTTMPEDARSSAYCTDVAKMIEAPVFHVNGDEPGEVAYAARLALEFRQRYGRDIVIDIVCYRRHGHNEGDEPAFTQPETYRSINAHPSTAALFRDRAVGEGWLSQDDADGIFERFQQRLESEHAELMALQETGDEHHNDAFAGSTSVYQPSFTHGPFETGIAVDRLRDLGAKLTAIPEGFELNDKLKRFVIDRRRKASAEGGPFDWAQAESLAFASLLEEGHPVRLSGQDCRRGTFSQRHAVLYDPRNRERHIPLNHLSDDQGRFAVFNSLLSEAAVLGFDYGYSLALPEQLTLWEAQFGDFANGAQVIIDQFISSAESKWGKPSGITLLLPHGYEGQGPEHSSARLERFLQLCAECNMQVCNLTTPAQYFHALRRQLKRPFRKPLIIMTPKSLLRHPAAVSHEADLAEETCFQEILDDPGLIADPSRVTRLIFCSGKVFYDLDEYRKKHEIKNAAIIRVEQIYPFHDERVKEIVARYPRANKKWVWCQEEPLNMGAWSFIWARLEKLTRSQIRYAGRDRSASPSAGAKAIHVREQANLVEDAFSV